MDTTLTSEAEALAVRAGTAPILVVDDEELPRRCFVAVLRRLGYCTETASSAKEALDRFDQRRHALVLTDHRMPGMTGTELAEEIKRRSPSTPVLMCSGHLPAGPLPVDATLEKPVAMSDLRHTLGVLLTTPATTCG